MANPRVLVIDDDEIVRELMCELLRARDCEVFDTNSPIGVTRLVLTHQIDAVVLDIMMPDMSGDKLAKLLRSHPRLAELSIILVSSRKPEDLAQLATEVGADAVVSKADMRVELARAVLSAHRRRMLSRVMQQ